MRKLAMLFLFAACNPPEVSSTEQALCPPEGCACYAHDDCDPPSSSNHRKTCSTAGTCSQSLCPANYRNCDLDSVTPSSGTNRGCEVYVYNNNNNCGGCGIVCSGATSCVGTSCQVTCTPAGCDPAASPNQYSGCYNGGCVDFFCPSGMGNCDLSGYCETNLQNDNNNCGACGNVCGGGTICISGTCTPAAACYPGCTGCDPASSATVYSTCSLGVCGEAACATGKRNCNLVEACETDITCDPANCGGCGVTCAAGQRCCNGVCASSC